jgi:hypothetical protein
MNHTKHSSIDPNQTEFVGIIWQPLGRRFRLAVGDVFQIDNRLCRVLRVNECAAVVLMNRPEKVIETRFRGTVRFTPPPAMFRISPNAECEILNRKRI